MINRVKIGCAVECHSDYMIGWRGIVTGYGGCGDTLCDTPDCVHIVEWTVPGKETKCSMSHMDDISEIPAMVYIAEQCR